GRRSLRRELDRRESDAVGLAAVRLEPGAVARRRARDLGRRTETLGSREAVAAAVDVSQPFVRVPAELYSHAAGVHVDGLEAAFRRRLETPNFFVNLGAVHGFGATGSELVDEPELHRRQIGKFLAGQRDELLGVVELQ